MLLTYEQCKWLNTVDDEEETYKVKDGCPKNILEEFKALNEFRLETEGKKFFINI